MLVASAHGAARRRACLPTAAASSQRDAWASFSSLRRAMSRASGVVQLILAGAARAAESRLHARKAQVLILTDSLLALCTATGAGAARSHKAIVARNRAALAALKATGAKVTLQHVRAYFFWTHQTRTVTAVAATVLWGKVAGEAGVVATQVHVV